MSALRTLRQLTTTSSRVFAARQLSTVARTRLPTLVAGANARVSAQRGFSVSARAFGEGTSDVALSAKLQEELNYEKEANAELAAKPEFLKVFEEQGVWQIDDVAGNDEVTLTRKFGNENIRLMFSIADIQSEEDEEFTSPESDADGQEGGEDESIHSFPIRASLSMTKTNVPGCLSVDMLCEEGHFIVDNISFYKDGKLGTDLTAEADWKRRGLYIGPQFDTLDVAVQEEFEKFLQERGVNEQVAMFIPEYAEHKEQAEYVEWLNNVKTFVDQ